MSIAPEGRYTRKLAAPTLGVSFTILAISAALLFFIVYAGTSMNRAARESELALVNAALSDTVNRTLMEQKGIVFWDDAATAAQAPKFDVAWFDAEVGAFFTEGYGHEQVYVLSPEDRVVYAYGGGGHIPLDRFEPLRPKLAPMLREIRTGAPRPYVSRDRAFGLSQQRYDRLGGARSGRWAANILYDSKGPVVVSAMTIVPTIDTSLLLKKPYLIVSIVRLDNSLFDLVGKSLQLENLRLVPLKAGDKKVIPLVADDGTARIGLSWEFRKPGELMLTRILPVFAILLLISALYSRSIFRRLNEAYGKLRDQEASARFLALHDGLSQLPNRRHFTQTLREKLAAAAGTGAAGRICVAYVDVDRFKDVNDAIGHGAGDALIMQIGPRLKDLLRADDLIARLGGDEFAILRELQPGEQPERFGEAIMAAFKRPFQVGSSQIDITASVGVALAPAGETDPERIVQDADISLYRAKDLGRNRFAIFESSMADEVRTRHEMEVDLRAAIGTEQIVIHYQPVISTRNGRVTSVEALVRWNHPKRGQIDPSRFISLAEQCGLIIPLGDHIIEQVFRDAHRFEDIDIAINLSPVQIRQRHLPDRIAQLARLFAVDPGRIVLEVTESMLLDAGGMSAGTLEALRSFGFRTALDDFGTGYSSLSYLHRFEFDKIKIDRSFVSSGSLEKLRPIVEAIVHIGRGLRMDIVAEGVESSAELAMVQALGCTEAQGYWISKPLPLEQIVAFIASPPQDLWTPNTLYVAHGAKGTSSAA